VYIIFELKEEPLEIVVALKERRRAPLCLYANSANALFFSSFSRLKRAAQNKSVLCKRSGGIKSLFAFPHTARPLIRPDWHMSKRSLCSIHWAPCEKKIIHLECVSWLFYLYSSNIILNAKMRKKWRVPSVEHFYTHHPPLKREPLCSIMCKICVCNLTWRRY
jgi:hypothetical protein